MSTYYPHHTEQRHEPSLAITLDAPSSHSHSHSKPTYKPGDTISGHVYRVGPSFIPEATVVVTLLGHTKTTIRAHDLGSSTLRYESSFNIFAGCFDTLVLHSKAPLSGSGMSWPFALTIPFSVLDVRESAQCEGEGEGGRERFYNSPDGSAGPSFIPPASFEVAEEFSYKDSSGVRASIEYMVQAKIEIAQGYYDETGRSFVQKVDPVTAPFTLTSVSYSPATTDFGNKVETFQRGVSTFRLIPGVEGKLSLKQKTRQTFMSSSVPTFVMRASISLPRFLQLGNPEVIPVIVYFEGLSTSSPLIEDVPQVITIKSLTLNLRPKTIFLAEFNPSYGGPPRRKSSEKLGAPVPMLPSTSIPDLKRAYDQEISFTVTPASTGSGASEIEECEPLDLGAILDLRMVNHVHPTFQTYNLARAWEMAWEMEVDVAGEGVGVGSAHEVVILPSAWEGPPPDAAGESLHLNEQVREGDLLPGYAGPDEELPAYSA